MDDLEGYYFRGGDRPRPFELDREVGEL